MTLRDYIPEEGTPHVLAFPKCTRRSSDDTRTIVAINTEAQDRHGTIIDPEGGDISAYRQNPVFLINHDYGMVAGNGANVRMQNGQWIAEVDDADWDLDDPDIAKWHNKVKKGIVKMASIGFMPKSIERITEEDEKGNEERKIIIREWDLLEWSFVAVGSNPEALVQQRTASLTRTKEIEELRADINALKNGGLKLSDEQIYKIAQRISGATPTPEETEPETPERESDSASPVLEYVEPRTRVLSPQEAIDRAVQQLKRKQGKA